MEELTDAQLVTLALAGQQAAFEVLVRRHQRMVRRWLQRLGRESALADDLAQETFVKAWQSLSAWRGDGAFHSWLLKIAWSQFLQDLRKRRSHAALLERVQQLNLPPACSSTQTTPDLDRLLAILTPQERACMLLCYSYGYSHTEASALLDLPLGTLKSVIRRAVLRIREHFGIEV